MTMLDQMMRDYEEKQMAEVGKVGVAVLAALIRKEPYETLEQMEAIAEKAWKMAAMFCYVGAKLMDVLPADDKAAP